MLLNFKFTLEFYHATPLKFTPDFRFAARFKIYARQRPLFADRRKRLTDKFLRPDLIYYCECEVCVADVAFAFTV